MTQAAFVALNIEPDEDSDDEIDDTKEIQVHNKLTATATRRLRALLI